MVALEPFDWTDVSGRSFLFWLVGAYVVLVPTLSFLPSLQPFNEKRAIQVGVLIAVAGGLLAMRAARQRWLTTVCRLPLAARWGLGGVLGLGLLSSALAPAPFYAFLEVGHFALLFVAAGLVASEVRRSPTWTQRAILGIVVVSAGLYAVYFVVGYGAHLAVSDIKPWPEGGTNYANIRFFNHHQTWTLPLLAGVVLSLPRRWRVGKGFAFGLVALWWALVFASSVRGTVVAMGVAAIGSGLLFRGRAKKWLLIQAAGVLLGLGLYYLLFSAGEAPRAADKFGDPTQYSRRLRHWRVCLEMAWAHPILGIGPMHFAWFPYPFTEPASPHSALMRGLAEWGVPSTIAMVGLTGWGGWQWMKQERKTESTPNGVPKAVGVALVASVLAGAAHSMVSGLILAPLSQMLLVLVGGWAWGRYRHAEQSTEINASVRSHVLLGALLLGSMLIVGGSLKDLSTIEERRSAFRESTDHRNRLSPRYWAQGYIGVRDSSVIERAGSVGGSD
ncbi:MAG: O-antigen ligase domain-containing protein [Bacteroidetes bacterium QS_3_64_15]|nr:MAG: O-antigen ligase domain-containing protein [Bacteroidetes bacterium QS_3_64_15]